MKKSTIKFRCAPEFTKLETMPATPMNLFLAADALRIQKGNGHDTYIGSSYIEIDGVEIDRAELLAVEELQAAHRWMQSTLPRLLSQPVA